MTRLFIAFFAAALLLPLKGAEAQTKITPSHVYQSAEDTVLELKLLLDANLSDTGTPEPTFDVSNKRPRHVIQKAQDLLRKLNVLKRINGVATTPLPPIPVREITPGDVKGIVDAVLGEVRGLKPIFGVTAPDSRVALRDGLKPTDVYKVLVQADSLIQRLDIPAVVPNDVYQVGLAMLDDLRQISDTLKTPLLEQGAPAAKGKKPAAVYDHAQVVLERLKVLVSSDPAMSIPGGITIPKAKSGSISPGDVIEMMNTVLAELSSIKNKIGATRSTALIPAQSGKTPSDAYTSVDNALLLLNAIIADRLGN